LHVLSATEPTSLRKKVSRSASGSRRHEGQHVELVGDEPSVREEVASEAPVRVRHVERDPSDVLATKDVVECSAKLVAALAVHDLHEALVLVVYDHRHEAPLIQLGSCLPHELMRLDARRSGK
jgi:hypothetical protein